MAALTTSQKLEKALECMEQAADWLKEAREENPSLVSHFGYSLALMIEDIPPTPSGRSLQDMIDAEGDKWHNL
jgi:hypothetical protein